MSGNGKFWMVFCEEGSSPKQKHDTMMNAIEEAKRIAQKEGKTTYVLGCIGYFEIPKPEPVFKSVDEPNYQKPSDGIGHVVREHLFGHKF